MKKNVSYLILLLLSASIFSCKKDFATFQKSNYNYESVTRNNAVPILSQDEFKEVVNEKKTLAENNLKTKEVETIVENPIEKTETKRLNIENNKLEKTKLSKAQIIEKQKANDQIFNVKKIEEETGSKLSFGQKIALKTLKLKANKSLNSGNIDTLSLLALIFGGAGLLFLFAGFGWLLGIAGFIMGLIALKKGTPNKTMAILGVVFGGIALLVGLLILLAVAAIFSTAASY